MRFLITRVTTREYEADRFEDLDGSYNRGQFGPSVICVGEEKIVAKSIQQISSLVDVKTTIRGELNK